MMRRTLESTKLKGLPFISYRLGFETLESRRWDDFEWFFSWVVDYV